MVHDTEPAATEWGDDMLIACGDMLGEFHNRAREDLASKFLPSQYPVVVALPYQRRAAPASHSNGYQARFQTRKWLIKSDRKKIGNVPCVNMEAILIIYRTGYTSPSDPTNGSHSERESSPEH